MDRLYAFCAFFLKTRFEYLHFDDDLSSIEVVAVASVSPQTLVLRCFLLKDRQPFPFSDRLQEILATFEDIVVPEPLTEVLRLPLADLYASPTSLHEKMAVEQFLRHWQERASVPWSIETPGSRRLLEGTLLLAKDLSCSLT